MTSMGDLSSCKKNCMIGKMEYAHSCIKTGSDASNRASPLSRTRATSQISSLLSNCQIIFSHHHTYSLKQLSLVMFRKTMYTGEATPVGKGGGTFFYLYYLPLNSLIIDSPQ